MIETALAHNLPLSLWRIDKTFCKYVNAISSGEETRRSIALLIPLAGETDELISTGWNFLTGERFYKVRFAWSIAAFANQETGILLNQRKSQVELAFQAAFRIHEFLVSLDYRHKQRT